MKNLKIFFVILLAIIFAPSLKEKCADLHCALHKIEHSVTYSNRGTKSEAKHGHLSVNGKELPDVFMSVRSEDATYKFYQRKYRWGKDGYFPYKEKDKTAVKKSAKKISKKELEKGYYTGKELLEGTPGNWLYTEWGDGSCYVSPEAVENMIQDLRLKIIPRWTGLKMPR